jgi:hypothetical protein
VLRDTLAGPPSASQRRLGNGSIRKITVEIMVRRRREVAIPIRLISHQSGNILGPKFSLTKRDRCHG